MAITYDSKKREDTLASRGLDFEDAGEVFDGVHFETEDVRKDYGEMRMLALACCAIEWWSLATPRVARIATSSV